MLRPGTPAFGPWEAPPCRAAHRKARRGPPRTGELRFRRLAQVPVLVVLLLTVAVVVPSASAPSTMATPRAAVTGGQGPVSAPRASTTAPALTSGPLGSPLSIGAPGSAHPATSPPPSAATSALAASLRLTSVVRGAVAAIDPAPHRPSPGPPLPNLTSGNITGFFVSPIGLSFPVTGNSGLTLTSAIGPMPSGANSSTFLFSILGESVSTNGTAFVGYLEGSFPGFGTAADPLYLVLNGTSLAACGFGGLSNIMTAGPTLHHFTMSATAGTWWSFTADGQIITGGNSLIGGGICPGNGNGTVDLGAGSTTIATIPLYAWMIPGNVSGVAPARVAVVCAFDAGGNWTQSQIGVLLLDAQVGVAGYLQDVTIPPDSLRMDPSLPVLTTGTLLWDTGPLPSLAIAVQGVPSSIPIGGQATFTVWGNDSTSHVGVAGGTLLLNSSLGGSFVQDPPGPALGEYHVTYLAPTLSAVANDTLTMTVTAPGYVGARQVDRVELVPTPLTVEARPPAGTVPSNDSRLVPVWINATGIGPTSPGSVVATVSGGGSVQLLAGGGTSVGVYTLVYRAPMFFRPSVSLLTINASGTGRLAGTHSFPFTVEPRPLTMGAVAGGTFAPGAPRVAPITVSTPEGAPPLASSSFWNVSFRSPAGATPLAQAPTIVALDGGATVSATFSSTFVGPVYFWANLSAPGFNGTGTNWTDQVQGVLAVQFVGVPAELQGGSSLTLGLSVHGAGGQPITLALVSWSARVGGFGATGTPGATSYTDAQGSTTAPYTAPSVSTNVALVIDVVVSEAYYPSAHASVNVTVTPNSGGSLGGAGQVLVPLDILLAVILALLLFVFLWQRRAGRHGGARPPKGASPRSSGSWAGAAGGEEGSEEEAPWPGPTSAADVEEEVGASDRPPEKRVGSGSRRPKPEVAPVPGTEVPPTEKEEAPADRPAHGPGEERPATEPAGAQEAPGPVAERATSEEAAPSDAGTTTDAASTSSIAPEERGASEGSLPHAAPDKARTEPGGPPATARAVEGPSSEATDPVPRPPAAPASSSDDGPSEDGRTDAPGPRPDAPPPRPRGRKGTKRPA